MASRKRQFGVDSVDNPVSFAPNELRRELFSIQCPLVEILRLRDAGPRINKFYGGQINGDVLQHVQKYLLDQELFDLACSSGAAQNGELHHRIVLQSIISMLQRSVKTDQLPEEDVSLLVKEGVMAEVFMGTDSTDSDSGASDEGEGEASQLNKPPPSRGTITTASDTGSLTSTSSREFILHHKDGRFRKDHQAVDVVINVYDKEVEQKHGIEKSMCASGIIDGKSANLAKRERWLLKKAWGVAFYAYVHAFHNAELGRYAPINFACTSRRDWASGVLVPEGILELQEGGTFSDAAFSDLLECQAESYRKVHGGKIPEEKRFTVEDIQKKLDEATELLHAYFAADVDKKTVLPGGPCLVGKVYIGQQVNDARVYPPKDPPTLGSLILLEGLMRIALGDQVLKWPDVASVKQLIRRSKDKIEAAVEDVWRSHNTRGMTMRLQSAGNKFA